MVEQTFCRTPSLYSDTACRSASDDVTDSCRQKCSHVRPPPPPHWVLLRQEGESSLRGPFAMRGGGPVLLAATVAGSAPHAGRARRSEPKTRLERRVLEATVAFLVLNSGRM